MNLYSWIIFGALVAVWAGIVFSAYKLRLGVVKTGVTVAVSGFFAFLGARVLHFLTSTGMSINQIHQLDFQNFSLYGGILGGGLAGYLMAKVTNIPIHKIANVSFVWIGVGIAIIRIGCFLEGCCYGKPTYLPWGIHPPLFSPAHWHQLSRGSATILSTQKIHPTQIYELLAALTASALGYKFLRRNRDNFTPAIVWVLVFTWLRLVIFFFRQIPDSYSSPGWLYPAGYLAIILVSLFLLFGHFLKIKTAMLISKKLKGIAGSRSLRGKTWRL